MPELPSNIDLSALNLDQSRLNTLDRLLNHIELLIQKDPQDAVKLLYNLKNEIVHLQSQKGKLGNRKLHATPRELKDAFKAHTKIIKIETNKDSSLYLLLVYAVECGIKSIYLKRNSLTGTDKIQDQSLISKDGHNLAFWIKELRLPPTIVGKYEEKNYPKIPDFHLDRDGSNWSMEKAHQAWRYGVKMKTEDEQKLVEWLESVCTWIEDNLYLRK